MERVQPLEADAEAPGFNVIVKSVQGQGQFGSASFTGFGGDLQVLSATVDDVVGSGK